MEKEGVAGLDGRAGAVQVQVQGVCLCRSLESVCGGGGSFCLIFRRGVRRQRAKKRAKGKPAPATHNQTHKAKVSAGGAVHCSWEPGTGSWSWICLTPRPDLLTILRRWALDDR